MTREDCPGCNSVPGTWICLFHGLPCVEQRRDELAFRDWLAQITLPTLENARVNGEAAK